MVNVFEGMHEVGVSVASMIFESTGFKPEKGDRLPETICTSCLQDARSAFDIKNTYERSSQLYCQLTKNSTEGDLFTDQNVVPVKEEDSSDLPSKIEHPYQFVVQYLPSKVEHQSDQCLVKNEPLDEDAFEEEHSPSPISDCGVIHSQCEVKIEEDDDYESDGYCEPGSSDGEENSTHTCSQCPKICTSKKDLKRHLRIHEEERPFRCTHCSAAFTRNGHLETHMLTHTGERLFKCSPSVQRPLNVTPIFRITCVFTQANDRSSASNAQRLLSIIHNFSIT